MTEVPNHNQESQPKDIHVDAQSRHFFEEDSTPVEPPMTPVRSISLTIWLILASLGAAALGVGAFTVFLTTDGQVTLQGISYLLAGLIFCALPWWFVGRGHPRIAFVVSIVPFLALLPVCGVVWVLSAL